MANERTSIQCKEVLDILDQKPLAELTDEVRAHVEGCAKCARYYRITLKLAAAAGNDRSVDLWKRFHILEASLEKKAFMSRLTGVIAGALTAAAVTVALLAGFLIRNNGMVTADKGNMIASNNVQVKTVGDYDMEASDLNYYYEISFRN